MIAESSVSAFATTTSYVFFEIMLADRPVLGLTMKSTSDITRNHEKKAQTIVVEVFDDMRKVLLCLLVEVGYSNTGRKDGVIRMFCR
jgi:hypothetical protein